MLLIIFLIVAFGLGSIPFSFILAKKVKGIDLRHHGSGNLGATNVPNRRRVTMADLTREWQRTPISPWHPNAFSARNRSISIVVFS